MGRGKKKKTPEQLRQERLNRELIERLEAAEREEQGGTLNSTAFREKEKPDGSGKTDIYFNGPGDREKHGHVTQREDSNGNTTYDYVRDVEGNCYIDR